MEGKAGRSVLNLRKTKKGFLNTDGKEGIKKVGTYFHRCATKDKCET